jgi:hypothetical protein
LAPFNTHFLIAEKLWPELEGPWQPYYGQFCFGCIAPDVDKASPVLTQKDTHFADRTGPWEMMASHRSAAFIEQQARFFTRPFPELEPAAQAFALGYLCHLCLDEVTKHMWQRDTWLHFRDIGPGPAFSALDEVVFQRINCYTCIVEGLHSMDVPDVIPRIPRVDLERLLQGLRCFVQGETIEAQFLALVDLFDRPNPEERRQRLENFRATIEAARQRVPIFRLDTLLAAGLSHSRRRLADLIAGRIPEPGYPEVE